MFDQDRKLSVLTSSEPIHACPPLGGRLRLSGERDCGFCLAASDTSFATRAMAAEMVATAAGSGKGPARHVASLARPQVGYGFDPRANQAKTFRARCVGVPTTHSRVGINTDGVECIGMHSNRAACVYERTEGVAQLKGNTFQATLPAFGTSSHHSKSSKHSPRRTLPIAYWAGGRGRQGSGATKYSSYSMPDGGQTREEYEAPICLGGPPNQLVLSPARHPWCTAGLVRGQAGQLQRTAVAPTARRRR